MQITFAMPSLPGAAHGRWSRLTVRQLTDVSLCKMYQHLQRNWHQLFKGYHAEVREVR